MYLFDMNLNTCRYKKANTIKQNNSKQRIEWRKMEQWYGTKLKWTKLDGFRMEQHEIEQNFCEIPCIFSAYCVIPPGGGLGRVAGL